MNPTKFTFQSQNLIVDYITFKFQDLDNLQQTIIAKYLFKLGFNSYQESGKLAKPIKEPILVNPKNQFEVSFVRDNSYWAGTLLHFSGTNATRFYFFAKEQIIDWTIFSSAVLSRFDLYYLRQNQIEDKISSQDFLSNSFKELQKTNKNVGYEKNSKGFILRIGSRRSDNYFRVYQTKNALKFEHEMKGKLIQKCHTLLIEGSFEEFEQKLSAHYLISFAKLLPFQYSQMSWLAIKLRPIRQQPILPSTLNSDYIKSEILMDTKHFIDLLQFLNYAQHLDFQIQSLGGVNYRQVTFKLRHFLHFKNPMIKQNNYYQLQKMKHFFYQLQAGLYVTSFTDEYFQSLVIIPQVRFYKCPKQKFLIAKVWLVEELFNYAYPFALPDIFQQKLTKYQFQVRVKFLQAYVSPSIQKEIFIKDFFSSYPSALTNQTKTRIKKDFIQLVKLFKEYNLIESKYKIISNRKLYHTDQLTTRNISEGFLFYEKLSI